MTASTRRSCWSCWSRSSASGSGGPALLMALSIPITLAMTFGMMHLLGIDIQQVSIASLIIALGLLVDDPVVAGDAIKRELGARASAARSRPGSGPTKLATRDPVRDDHQHRRLPAVPAAAGRHGQFIYSLPVVLTCSLVASRIVSMTFIPLLGYYLLRARRSRSRRSRSAARAASASSTTASSAGPSSIAGRSLVASLRARSSRGVAVAGS